MAGWALRVLFMFDSRRQVPIHLGREPAAGICETSQPFLDGYPFEVCFKSPDDKATG